MLTRGSLGSTYYWHSMKRDDRSWLLFSYLVHQIPCQALARIFIEGDFVTNLHACLRDEEPALGLGSAIPDGLDSVISIPELKIKKRKRDKAHQAKLPEGGQQPLPASFSTLRVASICAIIKRCVDLSMSDGDLFASEHMKLALTASPEIAASLINHLLSDIVSFLSQKNPESFNDSALIASVPGLLRLWEYRTLENDVSSERACNQEFTNYCLSPCLAFLQILQTNGLTTEYVQTVKQIERLVALYSILPARTEFTSIRSQLADPEMKDAAHGSPILAVFPRISDNLLPLLYDVAIRTIPRNTMRRKQNEQPWLDALFSKLAISYGDSDLQELLRVALTHKIALPQSELSQIAFRQFSSETMRWPLLVQIVKIDASIFFSKSAPLMERLCDKIADSADEDYALLRDSIVIPLTKVAGQTRELLDYVQIWHRRLSEKIQDRDNIDRRGSRVWQDPDLFAAFSEICKTHATPFFVSSMMHKSLEQITRASTEEDAMSRSQAWAAIFGSVITARTEDCLAEARVLRQLLEATATLIAHSPCPRTLRWRLWRLLRQILSILPDKDADDISQLNTGGFSTDTSLDHWNKGGDTAELIECFHLQIWRALARPDKHEQALREEFNHLAELLDAASQSSIHPSPFGLADACMSIILQNSDILLLARVDTLWPALWRYASSSRSITAQRLFKELSSSDTVTSNQTLLSQCFQVIHDSIAGHDRHRSDLAYKILLSMPCQNIKRSQERTKLMKVLEDAGIGRPTRDLTTIPSSKSEDNSLFNEFKSRASKPGPLTSQGSRVAILETDSFERLCLELDYMTLKLNSPNQYAVDDLLSVITLLTSRSSPTFSTMPHSGPSAIYQRLCSLTSILLTRFRKRLGGRYHLVLPVLQGLLRCLFQAIPIPVSSKQPQIRQHHPSWLLRPDTEPLTAKSATQYTRLLTSLCDPTASSVKQARHAGTAAALTDDTKKARSIAGQYMQYLVMEYALCQLQGQLPPGVKAALMPGLYAVLDAMPRDLMRGMNAAMDSSSRAIFKGLYEDYQRFGRWNQN